jgi:hypothetical protein
MRTPKSLYLESYFFILVRLAQKSMSFWSDSKLYEMAAFDFAQFFWGGDGDILNL